MTAPGTAGHYSNSRRDLEPPIQPNDAVVALAAATGSERLLLRQLETGQYFPVQRALYLAKHGLVG